MDASAWWDEMNFSKIQEHIKLLFMEQTSFFLLIFLKYKKKRLNNTKQLLITLNNFGHVRLLNFWVFRGRLLDVGTCLNFTVLKRVIGGKARTL